MAPPPPQDLGDNLSLEVGELELAAEAYSVMGGTPTEEEQHSDVELDERGIMMKISTHCGFSLGFCLLTSWFVCLPLVLSLELSPASPQEMQEVQEELDSLFDSGPEEQVPSPKPEGPPPLSQHDMANFDPCYQQGYRWRDSK